MSGAILYSFLWETALKSTVLLMAAGLIALLLRRRSAALRHLLWSVAFASVLMLPFFVLSLPALRVPVIRSVMTSGLIFQSNAQASGAGGTSESGLPARLSPGPKPKASVRWSLLLATLWLSGSAISFTQMSLGLVAIRRLRRRAVPLLLPDFAPLAKRLRIESEISLLQIGRGNMPITSGLFRPIVFLPADAAEWDEERRRVVLLHELAHVRRRDAATQLIARTALALHWWNPFAWAAWQGFLKEREGAADDLVLNLGARASDYAGHLLGIASAMQPAAAFGWAAVPMARRPELESRVSAILDPHRDRRTPRRMSGVAASLAALLILSPLAALQAKNDAAEPSSVGQSSVAPAASALIAEGDAAREQGKSAQSIAAYKRALAMLGTGPETATVLIHLGTVELVAGSFEQATADFEHAELTDASRSSEAKLWMAIAQQRQNKFETADGLFRSALAAEAPGSVLAAIIMNLHAEMLTQQGHQEQAAPLRSEAAAILKAQAAQRMSANGPSATDAYRVGGDVSAPVLSSKIEPVYTADARIAKYSGTVLLSVEIGVDGTAGNIKVIRPLGFGLDQKAIEAITQWHFKPGTRNGEPVKVAANVEINFRLL